MEIQRINYIQKLKEWKDTHSIKVLTGIRRCGKSTILNQFIKTLDKSENIIAYDFNNPKLITGHDHLSLYDEILSKSKKNIINYVFLDEIQEIINFERCVIGLFENKDYKFDIYLTGSNSKMFSSELRTLFTGRTKEFRIYSFTFKEIYENIYKNKHIDKCFDHYLNYGGLGISIPYYNDEHKLNSVLRDTFDQIINKDVIDHYKITNQHAITTIALYLANLIGNKTSSLDIQRHFKDNTAIKISNSTILYYLNYLTNTMVFNKVMYYDYKKNNILTNKHKYYGGDLGLISCINNDKSLRAYKIENLVYLELLNKDFIVYTFGDSKYPVRDIDFYATRNKDKWYIQVCEIINDKNFEREYIKLEKLKTSSGAKKILFYLDNEINNNSNKVKFASSDVECVNLLDWLKNDAISYHHL